MAGREAHNGEEGDGEKNSVWVSCCEEWTRQFVNSPNPMNAHSLNADVDLILPAIPLLKALNVTPGKRSSDHNTVTSANDLQEVVAYSMTTCSGVERAVTDKELFDHIMQLSVDIPHEVSMQLTVCLPRFNVFSTPPPGSRNTLVEMQHLWRRRW